MPQYSSWSVVAGAGRPRAGSTQPGLGVGILLLGKAGSLNAGVAAGIAVHVGRHRGKASPPNERLAADPAFCP